MLFGEGDPADFWWVLLDGRVELVRRAGRHEAVGDATMERPGVWAGGFRAWTRSRQLPGHRLAAPAPGRMLQLPSAALGELVRSWFPFGVHLIEGFFQTVRTMDTLSRQREALVALGTLAAGLAHELNNPASAATRARRRAAGDGRRRCSRRSCSSPSAPCRRQQFIALGGSAASCGPPTAGRRPARGRRPRGGAGGLAGRRTASTTRGASPPPLAAAGADVDWCDRVAAVLDGATLGPGLEWVAGTLSTTRPARRDQGVDRARLGARRLGEVVLAARSGRRAADRRHRGHREHARHARAQDAGRHHGGPRVRRRRSRGSRPIPAT